MAAKKRRTKKQKAATRKMIAAARKAVRLKRIARNKDWSDERLAHDERMEDLMRGSWYR